MYADIIALVSDSSVATVESSQGSFPTTLQPIAPNADITVAVLSETMLATDLVRLRREMTQTFSPVFVASHPMRLVFINGGNIYVNEALPSASGLPSILNRLQPGSNAAGGVIELFTFLSNNAAALGGNWSQLLIVGRLPALNSDEQQSAAFLSAWIGDRFLSQKIRVNFWSLEAGVPPWTQELSQSGLASSSSSLSDLAAAMNDTKPVYQANWQTSLTAGAWPTLLTLTNKSGERVGKLIGLISAKGFSTPLASYIEARAKLTRAQPDDESATKSVLAINPSDADALVALGKLYRRQHKAKEAAAVYRQLSELNPSDGTVWAELGLAAYASESFDEAEGALKRASDLGVKSRFGFQVRIRVLLRRSDYQAAFELTDKALAMPVEANSSDQMLYLLRADCAHGLKQWPVEAESLERAKALGAVPLERTSTLIEGYLAAKETDRALSQLRSATPELPKDAATLCRYAEFWERAQDDAAAATLWENALAADPKMEAGYVGLGANQLRLHRNSEASATIDRGLAAFPQSASLVVMKEKALEASGDIYGARRFLKERSAGLTSVDLLERRARLEDWYGSLGSEAYMDLLSLTVAQKGSAEKLTEISKRGLIVSIRDEKREQAQLFAAKLAESGDRSGLDLVNVKAEVSAHSTELPGGVEAFYFLLFGGGKGHAERILMDACSPVIAAFEDVGQPGAGKTKSQLIQLRFHEYFQRVAALAALGERKGSKIQVQLSLSDKAGKQRTEKVFSILGLKLRHGKQGATVESAMGKEQSKKQDTLAALAIDEQEIQDTLASGKPYVLALPMDRVPVFPAEEVWQQAFYQSNKYPGGLAEAFVSDVRIPRLYLALNSMDRQAAKSLLAAMPLRTLAERYSLSLSAFSSALAVRGGHAEVPGGRSAEPIWQALTGASPARPAEFFQAILNKDDGKLMAFFYTLSELDMPHQRFFTRSGERTKRFYELFRETREMRKGGEVKLGENSFIDFMRNVPLNDDGSVDFPGSPELWMVAKGRNSSGATVGKITRKLKKAAAPDDEDQILARLATLDYKSSTRQISELANFIAVTQIDEEREQPLSVESALLLAQGYAEYRGLFPYFAALGDLEAADYQAAFSFQAQVTKVDAALANLRLGEFHSALAMLGLLRQSGLVREADLIAAYRKCMQRYLAANDAATWAIASLDAVADLSKLAAAEVKSPDKAIRLLLIGSHATAATEKSFDQVLALQKVPSLDGLLSIRVGLKGANTDVHSLDEIQRQLAALSVIPLPKTWKYTGERKKSYDFFETARAQNQLVKLRERLLNKKRNAADVEKLSGQLMAELEPWVELAMTGRIYARFLDASDLLVSEDPMLLRKHEFLNLGPAAGPVEYFPSAKLHISSEGSGSYFEGGLATFSLVAGEARTMGNHVGAGASSAFSKALLASVRATDWRGLNESGLVSFSATVRLAREWIVGSATSAEMRATLDDALSGIVSINRRNTLLEALDVRDWRAVFGTLSIGDLHFLGDTLLEQAPNGLWNSDALKAMKLAAAHTHELDVLGPVAPDLNGSGEPRLRRYEPYEEYQRHLMPDRLSQRLSELKMYLACVSDAEAWPLEMLPQLSAPAADQLLKKVQMHNAWDWEAVLDAFRSMKAEELQGLVRQ